MDSCILIEMYKQSIDASGDNFYCKNCRHYKGGCGCEQCVFIAFVGANMSNCSYYQKGIKCPHCGEMFRPLQG